MTLSDAVCAPSATYCASLRRATPSRGLEALDRISEGVVYNGLLSLYNRYLEDGNDVTMMYLILLAMSGSFMVSYTKARAEVWAWNALEASCSGQNGSSCSVAGRSCLV